MRTVIFLGLFTVIIICCISCKCDKTVNEGLTIKIQNRTDSIIHVKLFPKNKSGRSYPFCEGCGYKDAELKLSPNYDDSYVWIETIFTSVDLDIEPHILAASAFDSIHIILKNNVIIKFTHENVSGYSENIFTENSTWDFRIIESNYPNMFCPNPGKEHHYSFVISDEKILIEKIV